VVVVDNGSVDGSVEMVRDDFPQVRLQRNSRNLGYGEAANQAIVACQTDYVLLLNSDTVLEAGTLDALCVYLDQHPAVAIAGPRLHNPDGTLQASCYPPPTPFHLFLEESRLGRLAAYLPAVRDRYLRTWPHDRAIPAPVVLGAALAIRRDAFLAAGGFDPAFFMYFEEIDLCHRLWQAGWQVHFTPVTTIIHTGGASTSRQAAAMKRQLFHSTRLFYSRHYSPGRMAALRMVMLPVMVLRLARDGVRYVLARDAQQRTALRGMIQVWIGIVDECLRWPANPTETRRGGLEQPGQFSG
jgi:GT2 family glycosyltransferase